MTSPNHIDLLSTRIKQLGEKSTQMLLFLSFSFVAVVTLKANSNLAETQQHALTVAMRWWVWALLPILIGIVPLKDLNWENERWYNRIRWFKFVVLWFAIVLILIGAVYFGIGIWPVGHAAQPNERGFIQPWNTKAIEAHYSDTQFFVGEKGNTLRAGFVFDLRNNTAADYTLEAHPSDTTIVMQRMKSSATLVSGMGLTWSPEHGPGTQQLDDRGIPSKVPKGFFVDAPIFIPSGQAVRICFWTEYDMFDIAAASPKDEKIHPKTVVQTALKDSESFVLLDKVNRYRIDLPLQDALR